ncbi:MAG: chemotaxis response regulator protein-glutamate methylesterase [Bacteroidales bacterium]|nr:chemotaxis response regulator protein-glutamate methylesterase [Bacteroidales bacterium]
MKKIRVLIVDDSAVVRQSLAGILESPGFIEIMGTAADPFIAAKKITVEVPDVITLDVDMPRMDGLTFLKRIMSQHPIPVVMISSLTQQGSVEALKAMDYGAIEVIPKPNLVTREFFEEAKIQIIDAVKAASISKLSRRKLNPATVTVSEKFSADAIIPDTYVKKPSEHTEKIIAVGASTGGTEAIKTFLEGLPVNAPGVVIVQHMPEVFTKAYAARLNSLLPLDIKEAENGDIVTTGRVLIAPGSHHMLLKRRGKEYSVEVKSGPLVNRHRPSVDVLFRSVARAAGSNAIGVLLTGMGDDGASGLLEMKQADARTIVQDEATCVVFGMPKEAIKLGAALKILPINRIAEEVMKL